MLTHSGHPLDQSNRGVRDSVPADRSVPLERATEVPSGAPATFSRAADACRLDAATIDRLIEQLPVSVLVADRDGRVVYANAAARQLGAGGHPPLRWALTRALLTEDVVCEEAFEFSEPTGPRGCFILTVSPVRSADGPVTGAVLTLADVTAKRQITHWEPIVESLMNL
jgi:PAS domain-containing protein